MSRKKGTKNKSKDKPQGYHASIKVLGKYFESSGNTVTEAITNLKVEKARGVSILVLSKGDKKEERIFSRLMTVRLFAPSAMMREYAVKHASERFNFYHEDRKIV